MVLFAFSDLTFFLNEVIFRHVCASTGTTCVDLHCAVLVGTELRIFICLEKLSDEMQKFTQELLIQMMMGE